MPPELIVFLYVLIRRPVRAMKIAWWWLTRRRVRARGQLGAAVRSLPATYRLWIYIKDSCAASSVIAHDPSAVASLEPAIALHLHLSSEADGDAEHTIASVLRNAGPNWQLIVTAPVHSSRPANLPFDDPRMQFLAHVSPGLGVRLALEHTGADWIVPLTEGSRLHPSALVRFRHALARACEAAPPPMVIYADEDQHDAFGRRRRPWFKPGWDRDLFVSQDYVFSACMLSREAAEAALARRPTWHPVSVADLTAAILLQPGAPPPRHAEFVALSRPLDAWSQVIPARRETIAELLDLEVDDGPFGTLSVTYPLPALPPKVSLIVPTRDRLDLLEPCVRGVLEETDWPDLELVVADNESIEPETLAYFERIAADRRVNVVRWPHPYNFSAINNFAVAQASGTYVCLLNNDTEVIERGWLTAMMRHAVRTGVGAVGARLLYPDRSIQHAGVVVGLGNAAGHAHRGLPAGKPGYFAQAQVARGATAVTAACLLVERRKFLEVGGLDETGLAIAYNDVDFCLKLGRAGYRNMYEPRAVLIHHESKSRGLDFAPEHMTRYLRELAVFQERWQTVGYKDFMHHVDLDIASEEYKLAL
ncbi:MAG: glycosyltransferase family 2 protein [Betaproteobacteria bacterium]|nr:glycosyltransferase family 2 protein [Betaproteobacteria bacterium]